MKVMMVNTPMAPTFKGGDLTQQRKTAEALKPLGVEVVESFDEEPDATGCDLAHVFNIRTLAHTPRQMAAIKRRGVPIVMSPIYLNPSVAIWGSRVIEHIFRTPRPDPEIDRMLEEFKEYKSAVRRSNNESWTAYTQNRSCPDYDKTQREMLAQVDYLLPNSYLEMDRMVKTLRVFDIPFTMVPYAVDPRQFLDPDPEPFIKKHGLKDFVIQVGRIEPSKNQLMMLYALRNLDLQVVLIGGSHISNYLEWCQRVCRPTLKIISHLPAEELRSGYAAARVHILPSWIETCGLVTMEAALANCSVVTSIAGYELEYYRDLAYYCDPCDVRSISKAVVQAYDNYPKDAGRRQQLKELILKEYTWERAAELTYQAYVSVLGKR